MTKWTNEDATALREFLRKVPILKVSSVMKAACPAVIDAETALKHDADGIARIAAMKAGWEAYEQNLFDLAGFTKKELAESGYKDMS